MADAWFYKVDGQENGPVPFDEISGMAQSGRIAPTDEIRFGESADWMPAESVVGLFPESDEPEVLANLDDLNFSFESSPAPPTQTEQSAESSVQTIDGLSELSDLSELNINLVSEEAASPGNGRNQPQPGSASAANNGNVASIDLEESWFYQSLGQELGPMTFEELCGLAESGALSGTDLVRKGTRDEWKPAESNTVLAMLLKASAIPDAPAETKPARPKKSSKKKSDAKKKSTAQKKRPAAAVEDPIDDLIDEEDDSAQEQAAPEPAAPTESWFCKIDGIEHGPLEFEDLKAMAAHGRLNRGDQVKLNDDGQWVLATTVTGLFAAAAPAAMPAATAGGMPGGAAFPQSPAMPAGISGGGYTPAASPKKPKAAKAPKTKRVKADRGPLFGDLGEKKPLIIGIGVIVALCVLVAVVGIMFSGGQSREHYATLLDIYKQHKALQEKKAKPAEWKPLVARANELQKTMVVELKKTASAKNRADQALLFCARDYLPGMLKTAQKKPSRDEEEFKRNLDDAGRILGVAN